MNRNNVGLTRHDITLIHRESSAENECEWLETCDCVRYLIQTIVLCGRRPRSSIDDVTINPFLNRRHSNTQVKNKASAGLLTACVTLS